MIEFTKEQLRGLPAETPMYYGSDGDWHYATKTDLAVFALALMEEREQARRELEALIEWRRTTSLDELVYGTGAMHEVVDLRVERDRLREELRGGDT